MRHVFSIVAAQLLLLLPSTLAVVYRGAAGDRQCVCYDIRTLEAYRGGEVQDCQHPLGRLTALHLLTQDQIGDGRLASGDANFMCGQLPGIAYSHVCCDTCTKHGCNVLSDQSYADPQRYPEEWKDWSAKYPADYSHDYSPKTSSAPPVIPVPTVPSKPATSATSTIREPPPAAPTPIAPSTTSPRQDGPGTSIAKTPEQLPTSRYTGVSSELISTSQSSSGVLPSDTSSIKNASGQSGTNVQSSFALSKTNISNAQDVDPSYTVVSGELQLGPEPSPAKPKISIPAWFGFYILCMIALALQS